MIERPKILAIIPARAGSKGVPKKNKKLLGGKPLIAFTIDSAKKSKYIDELVLSSDDESIMSIAKKLGANVPFKRPQHLSRDNSSSLEVVQHVIEFFEKQNTYFDAVLLLQPTAPFRDIYLIDKAIEKFIETNCDGLVSVMSLPHQYNPHWVFEEVDKGFLKISTGETEIIKRRQDLPKSYFRDGGIYLSKTEVVKNGSLYGNKLSYIESSSEFYVNIDDEKDWKQAEVMVNDYLKSIK